MNRKIMIVGTAVALAGLGTIVALVWQRHNASSSIAQLSPRDAEIIEFVLRSSPDDAGGRIYFLTITPMTQWGDEGAWLTLPRDFYSKIADLPAHYRPASEALFREGKVLQKHTNAEAWMRWVTIKRWISEAEVEVEEGVWCCPLGGGASTVIYEKQNGRWGLKKLGEMWVS